MDLHPSTNCVDAAKIIVHEVRKENQYNLYHFKTQLAKLIYVVPTINYVHYNLTRSTYFSAIPKNTIMYNIYVHHHNLIHQFNSQYIQSGATQTMPKYTKDTLQYYPLFADICIYMINNNYTDRDYCVQLLNYMMPHIESTIDFINKFGIHMDYCNIKFDIKTSTDTIQNDI